MRDNIPNPALREISLSSHARLKYGVLLFKIDLDRKISKGTLEEENGKGGSMSVSNVGRICGVSLHRSIWLDRDGLLRVRSAAKLPLLGF
jgi:hypothetical protein